MKQQSSTISLFSPLLFLLLLLVVGKLKLFLFLNDLHF
mgnify:CR=1 FL=1